MNLSPDAVVTNLYHTHGVMVGVRRPCCTHLASTGQRLPDPSRHGHWFLLSNIRIMRIPPTVQRTARLLAMTRWDWADWTVAPQTIYFRQPTPADLSQLNRMRVPVISRVSSHSFETRSLCFFFFFLNQFIFRVNRPEVQTGRDTKWATTFMRKNRM